METFSDVADWLAWLRENVLLQGLAYLAASLAVFRRASEEDFYGGALALGLPRTRFHCVSAPKSADFPWFRP